MMLKSRHSRQDQQGALLLLGLFALSGALALTAAGLTRSMTETLAAGRAVQVQQAFHAAEARLDDVLARLSLDPSYVGIDVCPPATTLPGSQTTCTLTDLTASLALPPTQRQVRLVINAFIPTQANPVSQRTIEATLEFQQDPLFPYAGSGPLVSFEVGNHLVDSYDSQLGAYPYAGSGPASLRPVATKIRSNSNIFFLSQMFSGGAKAYFWADMIVGPSYVPASSGLVVLPAANAWQVVLEGATVAEPEWSPPTLSIPAGSPTGSPYTPGNCDPAAPPQEFEVSVDMPSRITAGVSCKILVNGDGQAHLGEINLGSGAQLEFTGQVTVVTPKLINNGTAMLRVAPTATVQLYVVGQDPALVGITTNLINTTQDPKRFTLFVTSTGPSEVTVLAGQQFYGAIYAPQSAIYLATLSEVYGSLISGMNQDVGGLRLGYGAQIHHDLALLKRGQIRLGQPTLLSWREL